MKNTHLVPRKDGSKRYYHFRGCVPQDLISHLGGKKRFQISLKNVNYKDCLLVSVSLQTLTEQLFNDIRKGMKNLTLEDIKEDTHQVKSPHTYCKTNQVLVYIGFS